MLHTDQVHCSVQRPVIRPEKVILILELVQDADLFHLDIAGLAVPEGILEPGLPVNVQDFRPAGQHREITVDFQLAAGIVFQHRHDEGVVLHFQDRHKPVNELVHRLPLVRAAAQPRTQLRIGCALDVQRHLAGVPCDGVQARPDQLAFVQRAAPRREGRLVCRQRLVESVQLLLDGLRFIPPEDAVKQPPDAPDLPFLSHAFIPHFSAGFSFLPICSPAYTWHPAGWPRRQRVPAC